MAAGRHERPLDHQQILRRRHGDRLLILQPEVTRCGKVLLGRGQAARLPGAGRRIGSLTQAGR